MSDPEIPPKAKAEHDLLVLENSVSVGGPVMGINLGAHRILQIVAGIVMRCWALAGAAVLACLLLYWAYGGLLAFLLLCFATTGILYHTEDNLLYHPEMPAHSRVFVPVPSMFGLPYENVFVRSADGTLLHLFFIRQPGGAVAIDVAARPEYASKIWCLILENTFTSIPDMAKFLSIWKVGHLSVPTVFVSGLADTLVPPRMMSELHQRCASHHKQIVQFDSGTHNETWTSPGYYHSLATFLRGARVRHTGTPPTTAVKPV
ncbi:hypothetical protein C0J52_15394 [Blattella germanica]|nr:hypothetical protein C0J52_15394 [Blattella germanica]